MTGQDEGPMAPEHVLSVCAVRWKHKSRGKRANTADPLLGDDCSWADMIDVNERIAVSIVAEMIKRTDWRKRQTIAMRRVIDTTLRNASEPANFYAMPLYVSHGMLEAIEAASLRGGKWPVEHDEHVLPLAIYASGSKLIENPVSYIPNIRKALVGPICLVTPDENRLLDTKGHPDPDRPFMRYKGLIEAYRVSDGERIDPDAWTFQSHVEHMKTVPAYATGAVRYESGENLWQGILDALRTDIAA